MHQFEAVTHLLPRENCKLGRRRNISKDKVYYLPSSFLFLCVYYCSLMLHHPYKWVVHLATNIKRHLAGKVIRCERTFPVWWQEQFIFPAVAQQPFISMAHSNRKWNGGKKLPPVTCLVEKEEHHFGSKQSEKGSHLGPGFLKVDIGHHLVV